MRHSMSAKEWAEWNAEWAKKRDAWAKQAREAHKFDQDWKEWGKKWEAWGEQFGKGALPRLLQRRYQPRQFRPSRLRAQAPQYTYSYNYGCDENGNLVKIQATPGNTGNAAHMTRCSKVADTNANARRALVQARPGSRVTVEWTRTCATRCSIRSIVRSTGSRKPAKPTAKPRAGFLRRPDRRRKERAAGQSPAALFFGPQSSFLSSFFLSSSACAFASSAA